eukprot:14998842-Alexandrium_andersonii.AAC.1
MPSPAVWRILPACLLLPLAAGLFGVGGCFVLARAARRMPCVLAFPCASALGLGGCFVPACAVRRMLCWLALLCASAPGWLA